LTYEQLQALEVVKLDKLRGLARDMYIVSFYQGGIRFGVLCRLRKSNVSEGRLHYTMHKSSHERNLPLHPSAARILKKYKYQFPLDIDWKQEPKSIGAKNALMNKHLKSACRIAEIPEVSFHTARHSIADYAVKKKLTSKQLQGILGHSKLTTTEAYLKGFYREETDSGLNELFS
jgi:integrase